MHRLGVIVVMGLLLSGVLVAEAQQATLTSDPCDCLEPYRQALNEAVKAYETVHDRIRPIMLGDEIRLRDPMTISAVEWSELAESAEAAQSVLRAIEPPPWLADFHQMRIERLGLESAFAREVLKNGITVAEPAYTDARSALLDDTQETILRAGDVCVDFARLMELSAPDADGEQRYIVRESDTLSRIAARFGVSIESILAVNPRVDADRPLVGQAIVIPPPSPAGTPVSFATPAPNGGAGELTLPAAKATIAAYAANEASVAAIATGNAASGANELATAQADAAARATEVAALQAQQINAQVTATALAVVAANSVLDPNRQSVSVQTDLEGMLANDEDALDDARNELNTQFSRYPVGCRAGFSLIAGKAPEIVEGVDLARRVEDLLRDVRPDVFNEATGVELFALPNTRPYGEALIDIFF